MGNRGVLVGRRGPPGPVRIVLSSGIHHSRRRFSVLSYDKYITVSRFLRRRSELSASRQTETGRVLLCRPNNVIVGGVDCEPSVLGEIAEIANIFQWKVVRKEVSTHVHIAQ